MRRFILYFALLLSLPAVAQVVTESPKGFSTTRPQPTGTATISNPVIGTGSGVPDSLQLKTEMIGANRWYTSLSLAWFNKYMQQFVKDSFIKNQNSTTQTGNFNISGSGRAGQFITGNSIQGAGIQPFGSIVFGGARFNYNTAASNTLGSQTKYYTSFLDTVNNKMVFGDVLNPLGGSQTRVPAEFKTRTFVKNAPLDTGEVVRLKELNTKVGKATVDIYLDDYTDSYTGEDPTTHRNEGSAIVRAYNSITDTTVLHVIHMNPSKRYVQTLMADTGTAWKKPNIVFIGAKPRVAPNGQSLIDGTVVTGSLKFAASHLEFNGIGVDAGIDFCAANSITAGQDGFTPSFNPKHTGTSGDGPLGNSPHIDINIFNCISLVKPNASALPHGLQVEFANGVRIENSDAVFGFHCFVIKSQNVQMSNNRAYGADFGNGLIIKSDGYAPANDISISGMLIDTMPPGVKRPVAITYTVGLRLNPETKILRNVSITGLQVNGYATSIVADVTNKFTTRNSLKNVQINDGLLKNAIMGVRNRIPNSVDFHIGALSVRSVTNGVLADSGMVRITRMQSDSVTNGIVTNAGSVNVGDYTHSVGTYAYVASAGGNINVVTENLTGVTRDGGGAFTAKLRVVPVDASGNVILRDNAQFSFFGIGRPGSSTNGLRASFGNMVGMRLGGDSGSGTTVTDATTKAWRMGSEPYTIAQVPVGMLNALNTNTANVLSVGGGTGLMQAATEVAVYAAAAQNTTTGTKVISVTSAGINVLTGTAKAPTLTLVNTVAGVVGTDSILVKNGTTNVVGKIPSTTFAPAVNIVEVAGTSQQLAANSTYIFHNTSTAITAAIPVTNPPIGTLITILVDGVGRVKITQGAGQFIVSGGSTTTVGATGYIQTNTDNASISLRYVNTNKWMVSQSNTTPTIF